MNRGKLFWFKTLMPCCVALGLVGSIMMIIGGLTGIDASTRSIALNADPRFSTHTSFELRFVSYEESVVASGIFCLTSNLGLGVLCAYAWGKTSLTPGSSSEN